MGVSATSLEPLDGAAHLVQSILDILTTRVGTVVLARDYGSLVPDMIDRPGVPPTVVDIGVAAAEALARWEPRVTLDSVRMSAGGQDGTFGVAFGLTVLDDGSGLEVAL
ncbi:hypothetical protein BLTE_10420 [Blastochloris tepida]|uniref:IraD/Gp25-like domain-containing protein n=2 Tax=Blastochloris tepida TaxID=2233851 RepID=A0A348FYH4_9HYPH|nr:hypothetical protein BLTE_10420 [Blastochloris tepida]